MARKQNPKVPIQAGNVEDHLAWYTAQLGYFLWRKVRLGSQCRYQIWPAHKDWNPIPPHVKGAQPILTLGSMAELASWLLSENDSQQVLHESAVSELTRLAEA